MSAADLTRAFVGGRIIAFSVPLARALKSNDAAILLQQLSYWCENGMHAPECLKTQDEIEEATNLTRYEQERCRKVLRDLGVLIETRRDAPARLYYRVDFDRIAALLTPHSRMRETRILECEKPAIKHESFPHTLTKTLSDTVERNAADPQTPTDGGGGGDVVASFQRNQRMISAEERAPVGVTLPDASLVPFVGIDHDTDPPTAVQLRDRVRAEPGDRASMPNQHADPLQGMAYERMLGLTVWRQIVADFRALNPDLGAEWLRKTLAFLPAGLTREHLFDVFNRMDAIAAEAKQRNADAPGEFKMRNWRRWMHTRLEETAREVLAGD